MGLSTFDAFKHVHDNADCVQISEHQLKDLQRVLVLMLRDVKAACEDASVPFFLGGGSCLGAVRHQGFIPWDDDLDLNMSHNDFNAFKEFLNRLFPNKYWVHEPEITPGYTLAFPRIRLKGTVLRNRDDSPSSSEVGVYLDIFFIENLPDNIILRTLHGLGSLSIGFLYSCRRALDNDMQNRNLFGRRSEVYKTLKFKSNIGRMLAILSTEHWTTIWNKWNSIGKNGQSKYISIPSGRRHYFGELHERASFYPQKFVSFDGIEAPIPNKYDEYLSALYGDDYMVPPSEAQRETHVVYEFDLGEYSDKR